VSSDTLRQQVYQKALRLFPTTVSDPLAKKSGRVQEPLPIVDRRHETASWFVGITVEDRLVGFMQFKPDLTLMRYSSFQQRVDSLEGCPPAETWLNPATITERAATKATPDETLSTPRLTFDANPTRIVWAVDATNEAGKVRTIYIAGDYVYSP
jgi:hypothetical protein